MINIAEQEIVERFQKLDTSAKKRVLEILLAHVQQPFDYENWWKEVDNLQADIREHLDEQATVGALDLLNELREETS